MPARSSLNVSLTQELTAFIAAQVASGRYRSASEVVRASLRLLQRDESALATGSDHIGRVGGVDVEPGAGGVVLILLAARGQPAKS